MFRVCKMLFFPFGKKLLHLLELFLCNDALMSILNIKLAYVSLPSALSTRNSAPERAVLPSTF